MEARGCDSLPPVVRIAMVALVMSVVSASVAAQGPSLTALRVGVARPQIADTAMSRFASSGSGGKRVALGVVGAAIGTVGGAALAVMVLPQTPCGDDPGLCEAFKGAIAGSVLGAGLGAALPRGTGACSFARLAPRALVGAAAGYLVGFAVSGDPLSGMLLGGPLGAAVGSVVGAQRCLVR